MLALSYRAKVGIAFPDSKVARALLCVALRLAPASGKPVVAIRGALAELLAEVAQGNALARVVARLTCGEITRLVERRRA